MLTKWDAMTEKPVKCAKCKGCDAGEWKVLINGVWQPVCDGCARLHDMERRSDGKVMGKWDFKKTDKIMNRYIIGVDPAVPGGDYSVEYVVDDTLADNPFEVGEYFVKRDKDGNVIRAGTVL